MTVVDQLPLFTDAPQAPERRVPTPDELTTLDRLEVMQNDYGFLPTTRDELTAAIGLAGFQGTPGNTARHLNEILLHQQKATTDSPAQAVRSVAAEYEGFARRAQSDHQQLVNLKGDVRELMNPKVSLLEDAGGNPAVRQLVRFMDLDAYTGTRGRTYPGFDLLAKAERVRGPRGARAIVDRYSVTELEDEVAAHIADHLAGTTVGQARAIVERAINDQGRRLNFWTNRLREARNHGISKPIADRALAFLGASETN